MKVYDNIYLYHLDAEVQKMYIRQNRYDVQKIKESFLNIVKIAFLLCKSHLFVPFSNYLESELAYDCLNYFAKMEISLNPIVLLSTSPNMEMAFNKKREEHDENFNNPDFRYNHFLYGCLDLPGAFQQRQNSASEDIEKSFVESIGSGIWVPFKNTMSKKMTDFDKDESLTAIPGLLGGKAYISDYVTPLLVDKKDAYMYSVADKTMNMLITKWYLESYLKELNAVCLKDIPYINSDDILPEKDREKYPSYREIVGELSGLPYLKEMNMSIMQYIEKCSPQELAIFKYSQEWKNLLEIEKWTENARSIMAENVEENMEQDKRTRVAFGIITALPEEYAAVRLLFDTCHDDNNGKFGPGNSFVLGEIGENLVALAMLPKAGEEDAALYATNMKNRYTNLKYIFMVGIAGGVPSKTHLGDVVISTDGVIQLDYGKKTVEKFIVRGRGDATSIAIVERVKKIVADSLYEKLDFEGHLKNITLKCNNNVFAKPGVDMEEYEEYDEESKGYVKKCRKVSQEVTVKLGVVGTENSVLKDASLRDYYEKVYETIAFEMEAGGINRASQFAEITYITIRGITDFCDKCKNDLWHNYAAANAAIFTYLVISQI